MDSETRRALFEFYREEFERHIEAIESNGIFGAKVPSEMQPVCRRFLDGLDRVCDHAEFPALAETLLQRFDLLTRLSELERRKSH